MAGLMTNREDNRQPMNGQPMDESVGKPEGQAPGGGDGQKAYEAFVGNGMKIAYSPQVMPQLVEKIKGDGNPVEGLANAVAIIVGRLDDAATKAGKPVDQQVRAWGAKELLEQMAELVGPDGAGVHEFTQEEMAQAYEAASELFNASKGQQAQGQAGPQMQQEAPQGGRGGLLSPGPGMGQPAMGMA